MSESRQSLMKHFLAGGCGGVCAIFAGYPFDTVKVRLQTMQHKQYSGALDLTKKIIKHEGIRGFYKGMSVPIAGASPLFALYFFGYEAGKRLVHYGRDPSIEFTYGELFVAGGFSGFLATIIMAPGDRIKSLLQIQSSKTEAKFKGPLDALQKLYKEGGIRSIFKGSIATLMRDVHSTGIYYLSYDWLQDVLRPYGDDNYRTRVAKTVFAGGMAGIFFWLAALPIDVIKSRVQTSPDSSRKGIPQVFQELFRTEGIKGFFKGGTPVLLRAFPANAACFVGFESALLVLNKIAPNL